MRNLRLIGSALITALSLAGCKSLPPVVVPCPSPPSMPAACASLSPSDPAQSEVRSYLQQVERYLLELVQSAPQESQRP